MGMFKEVIKDVTLLDKHTSPQLMSMGTYKEVIKDVTLLV